MKNITIKPTYATVVFILRTDNLGNKTHILLGRKTRKHAVGRLNGPGGKKNLDETFPECAEREIKEELLLNEVQRDKLTQVAVIHSLNTDHDGSQKYWIVPVYLILEKYITGIPTSTKTFVDPSYYPIRGIPFNEMITGDESWLPRILNGEKLIVYLEYGPNQKELLFPPRIEVVENFNE